MPKNNPLDSIDEAIKLLEEKQALEEHALKEQFHSISERMKPINILKSTFDEVVESRDVKSNIFNASADMLSNFLSAKLFNSKKSSVAKKVIGNVLIHGITNMYIKNPKTYDIVEATINEFLGGKEKGTNTDVAH